jgi:hypothetical protein
MAGSSWVGQPAWGPSGARRIDSSHTQFRQYLDNAENARDDSQYGCEQPHLTLCHMIYSGHANAMFYSAKLKDGGWIHQSENQTDFMMA